jgi:hypothetical protein
MVCTAQIMHLITAKLIMHTLIQLTHFNKILENSKEMLYSL